ncbi:MAG: 23S rRNA (adenine(2503)-C(2))-methyltransferase RlmN [Vicinamibacterales bacterium]
MDTVRDASPLLPPTAAPDLAGLESAELERALEADGLRSFHARQIFRWVHARAVADFSRMTDLARPLRADLAARFRISEPAVADRHRSSDATEKFLLRLDDGRQIESVYIPEEGRATFCISSQAGCAMKCAFCLTGRMGLLRNLSAGEIVGQVRVLARELGLLDARFNIVLMGMGEPLHNYAATMKALRILADPLGLHVSPRRVTLSTVGLVAGIDKLREEAIMPNLAVSLHATTEEQRALLLPVSRAHALADVIEACRRFPLRKRSRITFEYVLLDGVNDSPEDARRLVRLLAGIRAKVNLIPLNAAPGIPFERPADEKVDRFAGILADRHVTVSVRKSRGRDIRAACGQLIVEGQARSPGQQLAAAMTEQD